MNTRMQRSLLVPLLWAVLSAASAAEDVPPAKDLTNTLSLLGLPCGEVVNATRQGDKDYIATCSNGNRYRVFVNAQGRVTARKL